MIEGPHALQMLVNSSTLIVQQILESLKCKDFRLPHLEQHSRNFAFIHEALKFKKYLMLGTDVSNPFLGLKGLLTFLFLQYSIKDFLAWYFW